MSSSLLSDHCLPCTGKTPPLTVTKVNALLKELHSDWDYNDTSISRSFTFPNYALALQFTHYISAIAETENHHPDVLLSWGKATITLTTHAIKNLSYNDFIIAAHADQGIKQTTLDITVKGRVQGVFFRKYTYDKAIKLSLTGWVQNQTDGTVKITIAGPLYACNAMLDWCFIGSPESNVKDVISTYSYQKQPIKGFEIR